MERDAVQQTLNEVFRDVFDDPSLQVRDAMTAADVAGWDSLNHVSLIVAVERKFGFRFTTKEVSSLKNVGEMIDLVQRKKSGGT